MTQARATMSGRVKDRNDSCTGARSQNRPTLYAKARLETTAIRNNCNRSRAAEVSYEPVWGQILLYYSLVRDYPLAGNSNPSYRKEQKLFTMEGGNEGFGNFAFSSACGSGVQRRACWSPGGCGGREKYTSFDKTDKMAGSRHQI